MRYRLKKCNATAFRERFIILCYPYNILHVYTCLSTSNTHYITSADNCLVSYLFRHSIICDIKNYAGFDRLHYRNDCICNSRPWHIFQKVISHQLYVTVIKKHIYSCIVDCCSLHVDKPNNIIFIAQTPRKQ